MSDYRYPYSAYIAGVLNANEFRVELLRELQNNPEHAEEALTFLSVVYKEFGMPEALYRELRKAAETELAKAAFRDYHGDNAQDFDDAEATVIQSPRHSEPGNGDNNDTHDFDENDATRINPALQADQARTETEIDDSEATQIGSLNDWGHTPESGSSHSGDAESETLISPGRAPADGPSPSPGTLYSDEDTLLQGAQADDAATLIRSEAERQHPSQTQTAPRRPSGSNAEDRATTTGTAGIEGMEAAAVAKKFGLPALVLLGIVAVVLFGPEQFNLLQSDTEPASPGPTVQSTKPATSGSPLNNEPPTPAPQQQQQQSSEDQLASGPDRNTSLLTQSPSRPQTPTTTPKTPAPTQLASASNDPYTLYKLLEQAVEADKLEPAEDGTTALAYLQRLKALDPEHPLLRDGRADIAQAYLERAQKAREQNRWAKAEQWVEKAVQVRLREQ